MKTPQEDYLERLDIALGTVPASQKLILFEKVRTQLESNPVKDLKEPEVVALRFMKQHGLLKHIKKSNFFIRWFFILFASFMFFLLSFGGIVTYLYQTQPTMVFDDENKQLNFFGGLFEIPLNMQWQYFNSDSPEGQNIYNGVEHIDLNNFKTLSILFINSDLKIETHSKNIIKWSCELSEEGSFNSLKLKNNSLNLSAYNGSECEIVIPENLSLIIKGENARVSIKDLLAPLSLQISNAAIKFQPHKLGFYQYQLEVKDGQIDTFNSKRGQNAHLIQMKIQNGSIKK